jgi:hypothetical protein
MTGSERSDVLAVDIGGQHGALIVYASHDLDGREVEIEPVGPLGTVTVHNVVRLRQLGDHVVAAAVFPDLPSGRYRPLHRGAAELITVTAAAVTEYTWPGTTSSSHDHRHSSLP